MTLRKVIESLSLKMFNKLVVVALRDMVRGKHGSAALYNSYIDDLRGLLQS